MIGTKGKGKDLRKSSMHDVERTIMYQRPVKFTAISLTKQKFCLRGS